MLRELLHGLIAQSATQAADSSAGSGGIFATLGWLPLVFIAMYFLIIRPQSQQQKKQADFLSQIKKGDEIVLQSGFFGKVFEVRPDDVIVELAPNVKVKVLKSAVSGQAPTTKTETKTEPEKKA